MPVRVASCEDLAELYRGRMEQGIEYGVRLLFGGWVLTGGGSGDVVVLACDKGR